jgi:hypothetical protein
MKTHLKISLFVALFISSFSVNAQKYAIEGGYVNPGRHGSSVSATYFNGGRLGVTANFDLKNNVSFLTGALYSFVYSDKLQNYPNSASVNYKTTGHFIDIPLRVLYTIPLFKNVKVFGFAGPNINIGLSQIQKTTSTLTDALNTFNKIVPGTSDLYKNSILNRLNIQLGVGGGVQWKKYQLKSGYDFGINNLNKLNTCNLYQNGWYVSFAYEF